MTMMLDILILLVLCVHEVWPRSQQPVSLNVWREHCRKSTLAMNDCNWCRCVNAQYVCSARICSDVDMFGHFNDAIQHMDVGMEGHGVWRSKSTACEPGVHYQKNALLCVCTEDGKWPNAVCRDLFQILHLVEPTKYIKPNKQACEVGHLYQIDCNVCLCGTKGHIDPEACTKRNCSEDISKVINVSDTNNYAVDEVYANCERAKAYNVGCKTCICLPNNRLLCDNCTLINNVETKVQLKEKSSINLCFNKTPGKRFSIDCNICYCGKKDILYCTALKCLENEHSTIDFPLDFEMVDPPMDDNDCIPGTSYKKDCNTCRCFRFNGLKYNSCTLEKCKGGKPVKSGEGGCVEGMKYEKNCMICHCVREKGVLTEFCTFNEECKIKDVTNRATEDETSLDLMHGYCEPLHIYKRDCNKCRCLSDGKTVACTSKICLPQLEVAQPIVAEFIPFIQKGNVCPKGHRYKVDCNLCQCLSNGNALCTTQTCIGRFRA